MRRLPLLAVLLLLVTGSSFAADHFILSPARLLNEQEQADLASRGLIIEQPLVNGRYLVRFAGNATVADDDPRIAALTPLTAGRKLHRTALREAASGRAYARLNVLFHQDVSFESARAAILASGGTLTEWSQTDFHEPRRISARIASGDVAKLAADERVLLVYGPMRLQIALENAQSALLANVTPVQTAPYDLTGQGVTLSLFELGAADASHREFGGRLTAHVTGGSTSDQNHATHVSGTMIASGIDLAAKGMAPNAMLHELDAQDDNFLDVKAGLVSTYSVVADNNSWGFVLGWCGPSSCADWVWTDTDLYYGAYDSFVSAPLDRITRTTGVLMVHSAGNDADKLGPQFAPFAHSHRDENNDDVTGYCYSANGSGTDCTAANCTNTPEFCEVTRHPQLTSQLPAPWLSIGLTASAKNVIAVGAVDSAKQIASFSSRGPARDGRVKPDLVTRGGRVYSTFPANGYSSLSGTSMSAPVVGGSSALLVEQWRRTFGGANPLPAVLKTLMLGTAQDLGNHGPDYTFGFGLLDVKAAVDTIIADGGQSRRIKVGTIATGGKMEMPLNVTSGQSLRVTLGWSDPDVLTFPVDSGDPTDPLAAATLINDLDLKVVDPSGIDILPYVLDPANP
ncbi:MAG: S8 family serine peptidase, partial [Thermoanaerobaculia bacterium]